MKRSKESDTLIIIPVFNEEKNIVKVIDELSGDFKGADILVVNDGSSDASAEALKGSNIFLLEHPFNLGIGASFQTGCLFALLYDYQYIIRIDGDGQHDTSFIQDLLTPIKNNQTDITVGSRFLGKSKFKSSFFRLLGIFIISSVLTVITKRKITDPTSGFCAMNKKAYKYFSQYCIDDYPEPEILMCHKEFRIKEIPISITKRQKGVSSITPLKSIYYMWKVLFSLFIEALRGGRR